MWVNCTLRHPENMECYLVEIKRYYKLSERIKFVHWQRLGACELFIMWHHIHICFHLTKLFTKINTVIQTRATNTMNVVQCHSLLEKWRRIESIQIETHAVLFNIKHTTHSNDNGNEYRTRNIFSVLYVYIARTTSMPLPTTWTTAQSVLSEHGWHKSKGIHKTFSEFNIRLMCHTLFIIALDRFCLLHSVYRHRILSESFCVAHRHHLCHANCQHYI